MNATATNNLGKKVDLILDRDDAQAWIDAWKGEETWRELAEATGRIEKRVADILAGERFQVTDDRIVISASLEDIYLCWFPDESVNVDDYDQRDVLGAAGRFIASITSALEE